MRQEGGERRRVVDMGGGREQGLEYAVALDVHRRREQLAQFGVADEEQRVEVRGGPVRDRGDLLQRAADQIRVRGGRRRRGGGGQRGSERLRRGGGRLRRGFGRLGRGCGGRRRGGVRRSDGRGGGLGVHDHVAPNSRSSFPSIPCALARSAE